MRLAAAFLLLMIAAICGEGPAIAAAPAIEMPPHARLNVRGDGWVCDYGYRRVGPGCIEIAVPRNATLGPYGDTWICLPGYYTYRDICLREEGADAYETPRQTFKPWQIVAQLSAKPASKRSERENTFYRFAPFLAAAVALGVWSFFFRGRDSAPQPTRNYSSTAITVQKPRRAVTVNAWRSAGEKVDALTGAVIPDGIEIAQCRNCRVFYRRESLVTLRRQNAAACIACGRSAFQTVKA